MSISVTDSLAHLEAAVANGRLGRACEEYGVELVTLFGSAHHGTDPHDVDMAVGFRHGIERDLLGVVGALAEFVPGDHLDVMDLDRAGPVARVEALVAARVLYEADAEVFNRREMQALGEYLDTAYLRESLIRELAR
ncbi:hypothetical protein [Mobilicoccus caccae]|uniref:Polymerase beta nucleotidyltransferase domain-containing protein n=1 Tax=Mobilicoccus caccae TaxID=1859295 RepID=A0ABQ6ITI1_9MICO|nr:hypothetical protein [Mobilicoccus caccae]GMA41240.1 hypothetical protein GCM10025883_32850 [Mobilicoccus caccae]